MKIWRTFLGIVLAVVLFLAGTNLWIMMLGRGRLLYDDPIELRDFAIVLGAGVRGEKLSGVLRGRMLKAIELQKAKVVKKILISGDGTDPYYNETYAMQRFALRNEVPSEGLIVDPHGYSTYTSITRAFKVFDVKSAYIISQEFHLSRAVWLANAMGMNAWGVPTGNVTDEWYYWFRELPARTKDFLLFSVGYFPDTKRPE